MALFDKLNDLARNIGDKTNDVIEATKLTGRVSSEKNAAGEELKKIGEFYYAKFAAGEEPAPEVLDFCVSARAHYEAADAAQAEIDRMRAEKESAAPAAGARCPECGAANAPGTRFCSSCGAKLEQESKTCPNCGEKLAPATRFCGGCGARVD